MSLRTYVFDILAADPILNDLGYTETTIYPNQGPDSPSGNRFMVLRWGTTTVGVGPSNVEDFNPWAYNRENDYGPVKAALARIAVLADGWAGAQHTPGEFPGWISGTQWLGESVDLYDDNYQAVTRNSTIRVAASG